MPFITINPGLSFAAAGANAEALPPVVITIPLGGSGGPSGHNPNPNAPTPNAPRASKQNQRNLRSLLNSRPKRVIFVVVVVALVAELFFLTYTGLGGSFGKQAAVNPSPTALISSQMHNNHGGLIADIGYDPALSFANYAPYIKSVDTNKLAPLSNNYLAQIESAGSDTPAADTPAPTTQIALIDETAVGRVIAFNADWSAYLAGNGTGNSSEVFNDVAPGSQAEQLVKAYDGYQIMVFRLAIGQIYSDGQNIYVLAQPQYTALKGGKWATVNDVFLYTLTRQENTLVISSIEQIKLPASTDTVNQQE